MITFSVNGDQHKVSSTITLADLLGELKLNGKRIAVELNHEIIPRSNFANTQLKQDDHIEIVHAIGGG